MITVLNAYFKRSNHSLIFLNDSFEGEHKGAQDPSRDQSGSIPVTYDVKHLSREGKDLASCVP